MGYSANNQAPKKNNLTWLWIVLGVGCGCGIFGVIIMAAILFPVFSQARIRAKSISCMSNIRNLGTAVQMYVQDYDDNFPVADKWTERIYPYYKNYNITRCPSVSTTDNGQYGYAYNDKIAGVNLGKIKNPAIYSLIYDSSNLQKNAHDAFTSLPVPARHGNGNVVTYVDGHVKLVPLSGSSGGN